MATSRHQAQQQTPSSGSNNSNIAVSGSGSASSFSSNNNEEDPRGLLRRSGSSWKTVVYKILVVFTVLLRVVLWPVRRLVHWIFPTPNVVENDFVASSWFVSSSYASTLSQVQEESKLLLVYLQSPFHPQSASCKLFLNDLLEPIVTTTDILTCWGGNVHSTDGCYVAQQLQVTQYPYLAMVHVKSSGGGNRNASSGATTTTATTMELLMSVAGDALRNPLNKVLLQNIMRSICVRQETLMAEANMRRLQLEEESRLRAEQDAEYQASLERDRQREHQRRSELEKQAQEEASQQQHIANLRSLLATPPTEPIVTIRFLLPSGTKLEQPFSSQDTLEKILAYLTIESLDRNLLPDTTRFGLCTNYPRKTLHTLPLSTTLQQAGLTPPSAVLMVQDLDA